MPINPQGFIARLLSQEIHPGVARGGDPRANAIARYMQEEGNRSRMGVYDPAWLERNMNPDEIEEPLWSPEDYQENENWTLSPAERELLDLTRPRGGS
jgi:hypothetical protein